MYFYDVILMLLGIKSTKKGLGFGAIVSRGPEGALDVS